MRKTLVLLLVCVLLGGCAVRQDGLLQSADLTAPGEIAYIQRQPVENRDESLTDHSPPISQAFGLQMLGSDLLVFSGDEQTVLTLLAGQSLSPKTSVALSHPLSHEDPSLRIFDDGLSFYRESTQETVVLDALLQEMRVIPAPVGLVGTPILSCDCNVLYYCTENAVMAWDLEENLHKTLKKMRYTSQTLTGIHLNDRILQCRILDGAREETLFLCSQTGKLLHSHAGRIRLSDMDNRYYAAFSRGHQQLLLYGCEPGPVHILLPEEPVQQHFFLKKSNCAVIATSGQSSDSLALYELDSGQRTAALSLAPGKAVLSAAGTPEGTVYLLVHSSKENTGTVYRWNCQSASSGGAQYTCRYATSHTPDPVGFQQCQEYANILSQKYGIRILIGKTAAEVEPWDYHLEAEDQPGLLMAELEALDQRLSRYPEEMLAATASHFSSLSICLVRQLTGSAESGCLDTAAGIQFLNGKDAYVVLAVGELSERTLYHELFHIMETHIFGNSIAFDQWNALNPSGFRYDFDYGANKSRDSGIYLLDSSRAFVDTYSMSFPREDRARIMEYAMIPEGEGLFASEIMQRKLRLLCQGIREAYRLEEDPSRFLWEQYLSKDDPIR